MVCCSPTTVEKVVGTATPKREESEDEGKSIWCLSTGDVLKIRWEDGPDFHLENEDSTETVHLILLLLLDPSSVC